MTEPLAGRPLRADAARNREKVLSAAREAFAESGYGVPLDEIAARAGVGPGTVYRHFPAKEALFEAVVTVRVQDLVADARARADASDPGRAFFGFLARITAESAAKRDLPDAISIAGSLREVPELSGGVLSKERGSGEKRGHEGPDKSFGGEMNSSSRAYHVRHTTGNPYYKSPWPRDPRNPDLPSLLKKALRKVPDRWATAAA